MSEWNVYDYYIDDGALLGSVDSDTLIGAMEKAKRKYGPPIRVKKI